MNKRTQSFLARTVFATALVLASACGNSSSSGTPTAKPPAGTTGTTPLTTPAPTDPRLPKWLSNTVDIVLPTCKGSTTTCSAGTNISGLFNIAQNVFTPVTETFFNMNVPASNGRNSTITGATLNIGFEDEKGFWDATVPEFEGAATLNAGQLDMIFSDSGLTFRLTATVVGDQMQSATVFYRVRQAGETQCQYTSYSCWVNYGSGPQASTSCPSGPPANTDVAVCKNYMLLGSPGVNQLGTITSTYSRWVQ